MSIFYNEASLSFILKLAATTPPPRMSSPFLDRTEISAVVRAAEKTMECKCEFAYSRVPRKGSAPLFVGLSCHAYFLCHLHLPAWCHMVESVDPEVRRFVTRSTAGEPTAEQALKAVQELRRSPSPKPVQQPPAPTPTKATPSKRRPASSCERNYIIETLIYPGGRHQQKRSKTAEGFTRINLLSDDEESSSSSSSTFAGITAADYLVDTSSNSDTPPRSRPVPWKSPANHNIASFPITAPASDEEEDDSEINSI